ncbi:MAG: hypothetical protein JEZ08_00660 [Clostridiales bacterium]|nr:hypothetical protein [Clostridiales bacterium]
MGFYIVFLELMITIWYLKDVFLNKSNSLFVMIIILLSYLCLKVLYYILREKNYSIIIEISTLVFLITFGILMYSPLLYFLGFTLVQFTSSYKKELAPFAMSCLILCVTVSLEYIESFILITVFGVLMTLFVKSSDNKIFDLKEKLQNRQDDVENLKLASLNKKQYDLNLLHTSRLEERNDIAQKLHDELGHTLSGSVMQLEAALLVLSKDTSKSKSMIETVINSLRDGSEAIRNILKRIKPETASLTIQTIKVMIDETELRSGVKINLIYDSEITDLTYKTWQVIIENIKEALTNMMKYAHATKCQIKFERLNKFYKITVIDNGVGARVIKQNMGLQGMKERLLDLKGQLIVDGSEGFSVIMLIPIERKQDGN